MIPSLLLAALVQVPVHPAGGEDQGSHLLGGIRDELRVVPAGDPASSSGPLLPSLEAASVVSGARVLALDPEGKAYLAIAREDLAALESRGEGALSLLFEVSEPPPPLLSDRGRWLVRATPEQLVGLQALGDARLIRIDDAYLELETTNGLRTELLREFRRRGAVVDPYWTIQRAPVVSRVPDPDDPYFLPSLQDYVRDCEIETAWRALRQVQAPLVPLTIAVIDSGIDRCHPDLVGRWAEALDLVRTAPPFDPWDRSGHGTRVAGILAATRGNGIGIAGIVDSGTKLISMCVEDGSEIKPTPAIRAIKAAVQKGVDVIAISWSMPGPSLELRKALEDAGRARGGRGILVVCSVGNPKPNLTDPDNDVQKAYPASYDLDHVVCVMGADADHEPKPGRRYGATTVDLAAPVQDVGTTGLGGGYVSFDGTSASVPVVAGVAALVLSHPGCATLTAPELRRLLIATADRAPGGLAGYCIAGGTVSASLLMNAHDPIFGHRHATGDLSRDAAGALFLVEADGTRTAIDLELLAPELWTRLPAPGGRSTGVRVGLFCVSSTAPWILTAIDPS